MDNALKDRFSSVTRSARQAVQKGFDAAQDYVTNSYGAARQYATRRYDRAKDYAIKRYGTARDYASKGYGVTKDYTGKGLDLGGEYARVGADFARRRTEDLNELMHTRPWVTIAATFLLGYMAARVVRTLFASSEDEARSRRRGRRT